MSDIEYSVEYDNEISDLHQDRPTQGELSGGGPISQTTAKTYSYSAKKGKSMEMDKDSECSGDDKATLPKMRKPTRPHSPLIVRTNHRKRLEDDPISPSMAAWDRRDGRGTSQ